ncbi:PTS system cellobiose-specific IIC component [Sporomusaceae bacterium BoRhaA]|uniref:PTS cellobiose transporter subunit IIC n=1 Tax=Pelorhabdus rhamnosifermentans TaxID=2772457 RepID=UPI001C062D87|nr:PTS cellobiose transporter subunit IIC [Pelorhabdus rhamnosifermentans]MBU2699724.1 PTS system cellobiose-specific IIC component [Pelorhabdus rhamnosifermentans]
MDGVIKWLEDYYAPIAARIGEQRHLKAIRDGIVSLIPLLLIGSLFLILAFPPVPVLADMVKPYVDNLCSVNNATMGLMGLMASFSVAYSLANSYKMDPLENSLFSVAAFMLATPFAKDGNITSSWMGSKGLFVAMLSAIFVVEIHRFMVKKNLVFKLPEGVPPAVTRSFVALIPGFISLAIVWLINSILLTSQTNIQGVIYKILAAPLISLGGTLPAFLLCIFFCQLLWCVGIHGAALVQGVMSPVWLTLAQQNAAAKAAGEAIPNIMCNQLWDVYALIGGSGATLALAFMLLMLSKSRQLKVLGKSAIGPSFFNINEPILFGMPIVMNPVLMIPFIFAPMISATIAYFAIDAGLVDKMFAIAPWTTPPIINAFLDTGDIKASVLQIGCFLVSGLIYYPFFKMWDKAKMKEEMAETQQSKIVPTQGFKA